MSDLFPKPTPEQLRGALRAAGFSLLGSEDGVAQYVAAERLVTENGRLRAQRDALLAACKRALHLVEENNEEVVKMVGAFGLLADLEATITLAEKPS